MLKYKIGVFIIFLFGICSIQLVSANEPPLPLFGKVIYIDPGHGGSDPGAVYKDIEEQAINLKISLKLEEILAKKGAMVYLTRYGDYDLSVNYTSNRKRSDLSRRGNMINTSNCDLFLSIHLNAEESGRWKGAEAYYDPKNEENEKIAKIMQESFKKYLYSKRTYKKTNDLYLQDRIDRPGVLLEVGFLSNASDRYLLVSEEYQTKVAEAIANGVLQYLS